LGWDDQAHWHPQVLRWKELEAICRCLAVRDPRLAHPGIPLLLLYRFAQADADDDQSAVRTTLAAGWRSLSLFSESEIVQAVQQTDTFVIPSEGNRQWVWDATHGWVNTGGDAYSLRQADNEQVPFALFNSLLAEAQRCGTSGAT
jgi:hypothetical protein